MSRWTNADTPGAVCESLPLAVASDLFMPPEEGGQLHRSKAFPHPDNHGRARTLCSRCPILADCLTGAMEDDAWTFRGGLSPEERAAFGGWRDPVTRRKRGVYLTRAQVWARIVTSALPESVLEPVLSEYAHRADAAGEADRPEAGECVPESAADWGAVLEQAAAV